MYRRYIDKFRLMSHVTCIDESCHIYTRDMSHVDESCHKWHDFRLLSLFLFLSLALFSSRFMTVSEISWLLNLSQPVDWNSFPYTLKANNLRRLSQNPYKWSVLRFASFGNSRCIKVVESRCELASSKSQDDPLWLFSRSLDLSLDLSLFSVT